MWLFIWAVLSIFVIGIFIWSFRILQQQKSSWKAFAKKMDMEYEAGKLMQSPAIRGDLGGFRTTVYTDSQKTEDIRGQRYVTVIDIELGEGMPTGALVAMPVFRPFADQVNFQDSYTPDHRDWDKEWLVRTRDAHKLKSYLTDERVDTLVSVFRMNNAFVLFMFDELEAILHIETTDPLRSAKHMDKILRRLIAAAKKLAPAADEKEKAAPPPAEEPEREEETPEATDVQSEETAPLEPENTEDDSQPEPDKSP